MRNAECPSDEELAQVVGGEAVRCAEGVADHLEHCSSCQQRLDRLVSLEPVPSWAKAALDRKPEPAERGPKPAFLSSLREMLPRIAATAVESPSLHDTPANSLPPEPCPTRLGAYDILGEIGRGGMAIVYKARQPVLDRTVALKRLRLRDQDHADVARFLREAESIARVPHANIVQVFEVGHDERPFLVLEYVDGGSLADFLSEAAPVEPLAAAEFLEKVARAVHHAHSHGVIHRDLKPTNILLAAPVSRPSAAARLGLKAYEPKVADFGLARRLDDDRGLTQPDMLAGTPAYLAPEQLSGRTGTLSPACDIYALGVILYEMLTGRPPLLGPTALATLRLVETVEPVPPRSLQPHLPRDLEAVCLKCLAKDPRRRYATAEELADDLARFLGGKPTLARPLNALSRLAKLIALHPQVATAVGLFVLALSCGVLGILWQWREAELARGNLQGALTAEAEQRRDAEENLYIGRLAQATALWESGDAVQSRALLAACVPKGGRTDLRGWEWHYLNRQFRPEVSIFQYQHWVYGLGTVPAPDGTAPEVAVAIGRPRMNSADIISPEDGRTGFLRPFGSDTSLRPGPVLPGAATSVAVHPTAKYVAWGTNTNHIVISRGTTSEVVRTITTSAPLARVCFSADGSKLFATTQDANLRAFDPETGNVLHETRATVGGPWELAVDPTGMCVAVGGWTNTIRLFDPRDFRVIGDLTGHADGVTSLAFSQKGTHLAAGCADGSVAIWDPVARKELRRIPGAGGPAYAVTWAADETTLAVGGGDRTVRIHDAMRLRLKGTYRGHESSVRSLVFALGEERLLSGAQDGSIRGWDATRDVRGRFMPFLGSLNDAAFQPSPNGLRVVAAATEQQVKTWSAINGRAIAQAAPPIIRRPAYPRVYTVFLNDGQQLAGLAKDDPNAVAVFDSTTGERRARFVAGSGPVQILGSDHARKLVVWATPATPADAVDIHWHKPGSDAQPQTIRLNARSVVALTIDPMSNQIAVLTGATRAGGDRSLWVLDTTGAREPREITRGTTIFGGLSFNAAGTLLAVSVNDAIEIYRTDTWELAHRMPLAPSTCLAFSPDGRRLAAIGYDGHATLFDPIAGKRIFTLRSLAPGRRDDMAADARVAFSPDGAWLLSTNWDGSVNVWDGRPVRD